MQIEIASGLTVEYIERFYDSAEADALFRDLLAIPMAPEVVEKFGKRFVMERRSIQYGVTYEFNSGVEKAQPWTPLMTSIRERTESVAGHRL